ncbi:MAG: hypothetical protein SPJ62_13510 [Inconstantimicrobium porci]|uniref:Uncharacterized protein n=1 Tax=Inconstantimicrobium porci TaxID=2652291 RepID=A0A7X2SZX6_9CLOT|nr:hypothetical protein [Inconstantimicrobium porci]MDD6770989.1 hypothetical protein [Inconstantimicrobium porci]MDY5912987.1 hypothetical protein [Inconstantimicrobium porci]MSR89924.1 hypothetical protein [Inconstantimicrobium porci]
MIKNRCPFCGSKRVKEIRYGSEGRDTKRYCCVPQYIFDNINRDFYCYQCRHIYSTDDLKRKAEYDKEKEKSKVILCVMFK